MVLSYFYSGHFENYEWIFGIFKLVEFFGCSRSKSSDVDPIVNKVARNWPRPLLSYIPPLVIIKLYALEATEKLNPRNNSFEFALSYKVFKYTIIDTSVTA